MYVRYSGIQNMRKRECKRITPEVELRYMVHHNFLHMNEMFVKCCSMNSENVLSNWVLTVKKSSDIQ